MTDNRLNYLGPLPEAKTFGRTRAEILSRVPWPFVAVVLIPTLLAAIYYLFIASPRYVSEAQFIVRAAGRSPRPWESLCRAWACPVPRPMHSRCTSTSVRATD